MWSKGSPSSMESSSPKQPPEELSVKLLHTTLDNNSGPEGPGRIENERLA